MNEYIPIICFVAGAVAGAALVYIGFKLGFRASYEIRQSRDELSIDEEKILFKPKNDPGEFELLEELEEEK